MAEMTTVSERGLVKLAPRLLNEHQSLEFGPLVMSTISNQDRAL